MTDTTQHDPSKPIACAFCGAVSMYAPLKPTHTQELQKQLRELDDEGYQPSTGAIGNKTADALAFHEKELARLREQVIQQQTRIVMMRNALLHYSDIRPDTLGRTVVLSEEGAVARNALATTDDLSALKAHDYALIEKCAEYAGSLNLTITSGEQKISLPKISQYIAAAIRSLKR